MWVAGLCVGLMGRRRNGKNRGFAKYTGVAGEDRKLGRKGDGKNIIRWAYWVMLRLR